MRCIVATKMRFNIRGFEKWNRFQGTVETCSTSTLADKGIEIVNAKEQMLSHFQKASPATLSET